MKVRFLLKKKSTRQKGLIYVALYLKDQVELISTGQLITHSEWSDTDQFPKDHQSQVAKIISDVRGRVNKAITRLDAREEIITPFSVKQEYSAFEEERLSKHLVLEKNQKKGKQQVVKRLAEQWLEESLFKYGPSTQKSIRESINQFIEFLGRSGNISISKSDLTAQIITSYERYLQEKKKLANSTHGKRMKHLRWFLRTIDYDVNSIKIRSGRKQIITLSNSEVESLENVEINSSELQKARDMFLLGCYTGLRISDLKRLNKTRIVDGKIKMTLQKNGKDVTIPLLPKAKTILKRNGNRSPKISEQVLNRAIKTLCQQAGINRKMTVRVNVAGLDTDKVEFKYNLITSHTAGKTFISLAPEWFGLTPSEVAAIVGKNLKTILNHYYELPLESAIKKMEAHGER